MERHSVERIVVIGFVNKILPAGFREKKLNFINFFETAVTFPIAPCLSQFLRFFLQTHSEAQFACCLAVLATLYLNWAKIFGSQKFPAGEFLAKIIENPHSFRGQVLLFHNYLL